MILSTISKFIYSNLPFLQTHSQLEAVEIFGKDLAESLKIRDESWEKVIESWNISLTAWRIIKESCNNFCEQPNHIACELQVNDGLILKVSKNYDKENQKYNDERIEGNLITPHGYIKLKFHNPESMKEFVHSLEKVFHKKFLAPSTYEEIYSFTLDPNKTAGYKPSYFHDTAGSALQEEFGKNEYSRTEALKIYTILSDHAGITIKGQPISPSSMSHDIC